MLLIILFSNTKGDSKLNLFQSIQGMVSSYYLKVLGLGEGKEVKNPLTISHYKTATNRLKKKKKQLKVSLVYKIVPV